MITVLAVGDICGESGLSFFERKLSTLKKYCGADMVIANGENIAPGGTGVTEDGIHRIFTAGADVITTGNHAFEVRGFENIYDNTKALLRPMNLGKGVPGCGMCIHDMGRCRVLVVNLVGRALPGMASTNFFDTMDDIINVADTPLIIVDFHAEFTAEKIAFARCFDGRVSLVFGTHTHVATADETILPGGTAYITDIGMTGPTESVIGARIDSAIRKQRFPVPARIIPADGPCELSGVVAEIDEKTGKARSIERMVVKD